MQQELILYQRSTPEVDIEYFLSFERRAQGWRFNFKNCPAEIAEFYIRTLNYLTWRKR